MGETSPSGLGLHFDPPHKNSVVNIPSHKIAHWKWSDLYAEIYAAGQNNNISTEGLRLHLDGKPVFDCIGLEAYRFNHTTAKDVQEPALLLALRNRYITVLMHCIEYPTGSGQYVFRDLNMSRRSFQIDKPEDIEAFKKIYLRSNDIIGLFPDYQENAVSTLQTIHDLQQRLNGCRMRLPITPGWILFPEMHNNNQILLSELGMTSPQDLKRLIELQNECKNEVFYYDRENGLTHLLRRIEQIREQYPPAATETGPPD
ncbi:hypothetical protein ICN84_04815 [Akkermansia glycaniphila]|uniref:hypothetical protein n=1 Tax=Akkermansia glycaniphila TaxID=1679444 RepID=UPI001C0202C4|nr:hypothetical protein [Akkermansia glycaniphila]MBT9449396.1 hypothetical protein [Akkermansia glycaniphila]